MPQKGPRKTGEQRKGDRRGGDRRGGDRRKSDRRSGEAPTVAAVLELCDDAPDDVEQVEVQRVVVEDRRRHTRIGLRHPADVKHRVQAAEGRLDDISAGGARFTTRHVDLDAAEGSFVTLRFSCRQGTQRVDLQCVARVVHSRSYHDGQHDVRSMAVRFVDPLDISVLSFEGPSA